MAVEPRCLLLTSVSSEISATGGIRVGWFGGSWPFATLRASANRLSLSCSFFGSWEFSPEEVVRLEAQRSLFGLSGGVRIVHAKPLYPNEIIFWCFGRPDPLIRRMGQVGFRPRPGAAQYAAAAQIAERERNPIRWTFIIAFLAVWNGLLILDWNAPGYDPHRPGPLSLLAVTLLVFTAFGLPRSSEIQALVLKPGRSVSEIFPFVRLAQMISGALLGAFGIEYLFRWIEW